MTAESLLNTFVSEVQPSSRHAQLAFTTRRLDEAMVLALHGEVDVDTAPDLRRQISELADLGRDLVIDMREVAFLDSTGLGVLVGGLKRVRAYDGALRLVFTQHATLRLFELTGLSKVFRIFETVDEALAASRNA